VLLRVFQMTPSSRRLARELPCCPVRPPCSLIPFDSINDCRQSNSNKEIRVFQISVFNSVLLQTDDSAVPVTTSGEFEIHEVYIHTDGPRDFANSNGTAPIWIYSST